ncbi:hypothetical protein LOK49_LG11G02283 [Camellia lanceoleosa]|uniref:Uncharacterized protein n=1 Tax=Camellia lanceoleosa TaxID=1840588 RepID=A0ACC0G0X5_9ERIC|nr:hypothetical protein LOK49_LG11G02283 [Camellia lanceoleosa]
MRFKRSIVGETHLTRTTPSEPHSVELELWNRTEIDIENQNCESVRLRTRIGGIGEVHIGGIVGRWAGIREIDFADMAIGHGKVHVYDPSHHVPSVPLQLMDQHQKHENEIEEGESGDDEKFRILGHSMFLKRMRTQQWRTVTTMVDSVNPPEQAIGHGKVHVYDPSHHVPSVPLQLMDQHQKHENEIEEGESGDDEKFRILGHSMFLKRMRVGESVEK